MMDILSQVYNKSVAENDRNLRFWNDYLQSLKSIDFNTYSEQLKVPVLVPIGSRILFRGEIKHTNEVTIALGADYFVKCSLKQADVIRQHRIKGAQEKVNDYITEKEYLQTKMAFAKQNITDNQGQEIIEYHTEDEDNAWRKKHRQNVKKYMQNRGKEEDNENQKDDVTDEELWERLEELELQEELENELTGDDHGITLSSIRERKKESFDTHKEDNIKIKDTEPSSIRKDEVKAEKELKNKKVTFKETKTPEQQSSKLNLLQQVIDRQNELDEKLQELKNRERSESKTEKDLMSRLDELEQLDDLEDEMDRLDDIIETEDIELSEEEDELDTYSKLKRRVSFVDEDDSKTLNLTFTHSEVEPNKEPYNPEQGIQKPSDIYQAHSKLFATGTTSILKKSKYAVIEDELPETSTTKPVIKVVKEVRTQVDLPAPETPDPTDSQTIVIKDVVEKMGQDYDGKVQTEAKPMSLFKKKRMQNKS